MPDATAQSESDVETYVRALAVRQIWQESWKPNKEGGGRCGSTEGLLPAVTWPSKNQLDFSYSKVLRLVREQSR